MGTFIEGLVNAKLRNMKEMNNVYEVGHVVKVKDYILEVSGLENVGFYERVVISNYSVGYVTAIKKNTVMVAILQKAGDIYVGDEVVTTGFDFCAMFSRASIGHIVDLFGNDRLLDEKFDALKPLPIETNPIPIMERGPVNRPLYTGIGLVSIGNGFNASNFSSKSLSFPKRSTI